MTICVFRPNGHRASADYLHPVDASPCPVTPSCKYCMRTFQDHVALSLHVRQHEQSGQERGWSCSYCDRTFVTSKGRNEHQRLHTGEGFRCNMCPKVFTTAQILQRHMGGVHSIGERYHCSRCGRSFTRRDVLSIHLKKGICMPRS